MDADARVALLTGGSRGIGRAICEHLLAAGWRVLNLDLAPSPAAHERLHDFTIDLVDTGAARSLGVRLAHEHAIEALVSNAGISRPATLEAATDADLAALADLHLGAALVLTQAVVPGMTRRRHGRIVLMASRAALGKTGRALYGATKAGLMGFARTAALELAPLGITVNAVAPGPVLTDLYRAGNDTAEQARQTEAIPVGRMGTPEDVARAVMFFVDPLNGFVTGQTLYVCGGASVGRIT